MHPLLIVPIAASLLAAATASAEPLIYEGSLAGLPGDAQAVDLRFALFADPAAGAPVWVSDDLQLDVSPDGRFVAELERGPGGMLQPYHFAGSRWLEVTVLPPGDAAVTLAPRQRIGWTPTAFDPTIKGRAEDGRFLISVHCGGGAHAEGAAERFDDLLAAVRWLEDKRIADGTTVRIAVRSDCTLDSELRISHPNGQRIEIVGDPDGLEAPILSFGGDGIIVGGGDRLGLLEGFRIRRNPPAPDGPVSRGIWVHQGSVLLADDLTVEGFYYGIVAENGGLVIDPSDEQGSLISRGNETGFGAFWGGLIRAYEAEAHGNQGIGIIANGNSTFVSSRAIASANGSHGFRATHGSVMRLIGATASENGSHGVQTSQNSHAYADYSYSTGNVGGGFIVSQGGSMDASASTAKENDGVGYAAYSTGYLSASRSYAVENQSSALHADREGYIYFRCGPRSAQQEELNPDGPPPPQPIIGPDDRTPAEVVAEDEGLIDMLTCPGGAEGVDITGRDLSRTTGFVDHAQAAAPCCVDP